MATSRPKHDRIVESACPLDCPDSCSLLVATSGGRIVSLDGSRRNPVTGGFICAKVRKFGERVHGAARVQHPMGRVGPKGNGAFSRLTWDEAIDLVAGRLRETRDTFGGEAILPFCYGGSNGLLTQDATDARLFRRLGASRLARNVCAAPTGAALEAIYGKMPSVTYQDFTHAKLIVIWGANPSVSSIHLVPFIQAARKEGAKLVVVDPRLTALARTADLHVPLAPGTDLAVALVLHRHLFETGAADQAFLAAHADGADALRERAAEWTFERAASVAGVQASMLREFAELYAATSPAIVRCGWGLERNRNGGSAAAAVLALPAVAGKFGVRGGGFALSNSSAWGIEKTWIGEPEPATRIVNMNHLGRVLTEDTRPPVKLLFVYNCNPLATMPDQNRVQQGLLRDDLTTIVFDQVMTDTARYADVVLPATTFLESYDLARAYGPINLQLTQPAIDAVGEARPNIEVFADIQRRLGLSQEGDPADDLEMMLTVLDALPAPIGDALKQQERPVPPFGFAPVQFVDVFPRTPDQKVHLFPEALEQEAPLGLYTWQDDPATAQYPLALISPASEKTISSSLGELIDKPAELTIHPDDARARQIEEADRVRVYNGLGEVHCVASVSPLVRAGTVALPKGLWSRHTANGSTANALAPDTLSDIGAGACFNDARVNVEKLEDDAARERMAELGARVH